jgi:hypothetical protein
MRTNIHSCWHDHEPLKVHLRVRVCWGQPPAGIGGVTAGGVARVQRDARLAARSSQATGSGSSHAASRPHDGGARRRLGALGLSPRGVRRRRRRRRRLLLARRARNALGTAT